MAREEATLIVRKQCECTEQCLGTDYKPDENLWIRIKGHFNLSDTVMGTCYKLHGDEEESNDQLIGKQLGRESPWDPANMKVIMSQQYVLISKEGQQQSVLC